MFQTINSKPFYEKGFICTVNGITDDVTLNNLLCFIGSKDMRQNSVKS